MTDINPIVIIIFLFASSVAMVMLLSFFRWPTIPAYFITGMLVGPSGLGVLDNNATVHVTAEIGLIFLLFAIGLKFSLSALRTIRDYVLWLGGAQTILTTILFGGITWWLTGEVMLSFLAGCVAAMSSTAIVSQILINENILSSPTGNRSMGVLLFQDLAVIPLIVIFSSGTSAESLLYTTVLVFLKAGGVLVVVLYLGAPVMSSWLNFVGERGDKELYMLNLIMIICVMSGLSAWLGLSYALGAFVAGILMSETLHRYRVSRIVEPFRHVFLGFFFVSLGLVADPWYMLTHWTPVLAAAGLLVVKGILIFFCARALGTHFKTAVYTSLLLCGAGEFGFILLTLARSSDIIEDSVFQFLLSTNLIALIAAPFVWRRRTLFLRLLSRRDWLTDAKKVTDNLSQTMSMTDHVVICGYGRTGQAIAGILRELEVPYVALEENYQILQTVGGVDNIVYAEASSIDGLISGNILRARAAVISYTDPTDSVSAIKRARSLNPRLKIIARADNAAMADMLINAGANDAYVDAHEFGFSVARHLAAKVYGLIGLGDSILRARKRENPFFTGEFAASLYDESSGTESFIGFGVRHEFAAAREVLDDCKIISWRRDGKMMSSFDVGQVLQIGDELVISGDRKKIQAIKEKIEIPA